MPRFACYRNIQNTFKKRLLYHFVSVCLCLCLYLSPTHTHAHTSKKDSHHLFDILFGLPAALYLNLNFAYNRNVKIFPPHHLLGITFAIRLCIYQFRNLLIQILVCVIFVSSFSLTFIIIFCLYICPFVFLSFNFCSMVPR